MHLLYLKKISNLILNRSVYILNRYLNLTLTPLYPSFLSFEVWNKCNLRCPDCAIGQSMTTTLNQALPYPTYEKILSEAGPRLLTAIFYFQGEPLLNKELPKYISLAKRYKIFTQISTNAQSYTYSMLHSLVHSGIDKIVVSIDGVSQESYSKYRIGGDMEKSVSFIETIRSIRQKSKKHLPIIEAQMIVFRHNEHEIPRFRTLAKKWGADIVTIKTAFIAQEHRPSSVPSIKKHSRYRFDKKSSSWVPLRRNRSLCFRCVTGAVINSDAHVLPCCYDKLSSHSFGIVDYSPSSADSGFITIFRNSKASRFRNKVLHSRSSISICDECPD